MARAQLLYHLVKTGIQGDVEQFKKTALALAEEKDSGRQQAVASEIRRIVHEFQHQQKVLPIGNSGAPHKAEGLDSSTAQISFDSIVLTKPAHDVCEDIIHEHKNLTLLQKHNLQPRHKILLSGPPGNGKTSLAEALAFELRMPFFKVNYDTLVSKYLGETSKAVAELFAEIESRRCVLFFDEFDAISKTRSDENELGEVKRVVNSLLLKLDSISSNVVLIAATNHAELLDKAVWRRFDVKLALDNPNKDMISSWFDVFSNRVDYDWTPHKSDLIPKLDGKCFADIEKATLDLWRKYILSNGRANMSELIDSYVL